MERRGRSPCFSPDDHVHAGDHEVDLLGHLARMVPHPLQELEDGDVVGAHVGAVLVGVDEPDYLHEALPHGLVQVVVLLHDAAEAVHGLLLEALGDDPHHLHHGPTHGGDEVPGGIRLPLGQVLGGHGDVLAVLADALQVGDGLQHCHYGPGVHRRGLVEGQDPGGHVLYLGVVPADGLEVDYDLLGLLHVVGGDGVHGGGDHLRRQVAHLHGLRDHRVYVVDESLHDITRISR